MENASRPSPSTSEPPESWKPARRLALALASPIQRFLAIEAASGILLMLAAAAALACANSRWQGAYDALWHIPFGVSVAGWTFERSLHFWINDGLMAVFFFVVGLEIRRELYEGELRSLRLAALPLAAAIGGMLAPALLFAALNHGRSGAGGWAIPMATDIAFAVGALTLLGPRVPAALRILLLALAVIDDIGAILVIAIFYAGGFSMTGAAVAAAALFSIWMLRSAGVRSPVAYVPLGLLLWGGVYAAGIHPTVAGVILGLSTPVRPWFGASGFAEATRAHLDAIDAADHHEFLRRLDSVEEARREAVSPAERLLHLLHPWVAFAIMPLFALANAGVSVGSAGLDGDARLVFAGIVVGLGLGKPLGIFCFPMAARAAGLATASEAMTARGLLLVGLVSGIGFTMSLFIAQLAFEGTPLLETAKLGVLAGSGLAMVVSLAYGSRLPRAAVPGPS